MQVVSKKLMFSNTLYSILKVLTQVILPAMATLYVALAAIWSFGYVSQVVGTITALVTFLGVSLHLSSANYVASGAAYNGTISIAPNPASTGSTLSMQIDPNDVASRDSIHLQVVRPTVAVSSADPPPVPHPPTPVTPAATPSTPLPPTGPVGG